MAKNVKINGATYSAVPSVAIPLADGSGNATFYETSDANVYAQYIMSGYKAYGASGLIQGNATVPSVSQDSSTKILTIS